MDDEFTLHFGQRRAIQIAKSVVLAEDVALLRGSTGALGGDVQARSRAAAGRGLLWEASSNYMVNGFGVDRNQLFTDFVICIATLNDLGQPGPYALILESGAFANTYKIVAPTTNPVADRIGPLVTGGFYLSGALASRRRRHQTPNYTDREEFKGLSLVVYSFLSAEIRYRSMLALT